MRKLILSAALTAGAFAAVPAFAQSAPDGDKPAFSGPRVEATLGYDYLRAHGSNSRQSIDGLLFGGGIGYDARIGDGLVLGVEGEATGSTAYSYAQAYGNNFGYGRVRPGRDLYAGARIGTLISPTTLIYAKGGYTNAQLRVLAGNTNVSTSTNFKLDGYRVGAGVEHQISANTYAKVEYRYSNYRRAHIDYPNGASSSRFNVDTDRHQAAVSYGLRF